MTKQLGLLEVLLLFVFLSVGQRMVDVGLLFWGALMFCRQVPRPVGPERTARSLARSESPDSARRGVLVLKERPCPLASPFSQRKGFRNRNKHGRVKVDNDSRLSIR